MSWKVTFVLLDAYSRTTQKTFVNDRALLADAASDTTAMIALLEAASDLVVTKTILSQETFIAASPNAGANVDVGGTLHVRLNNGVQYGFKIPGIDPALINTDGSIMITETEITDLTGAFASGGHWTVSEGNTIGSILYGELDR